MSVPSLTRHKSSAVYRYQLAGEERRAIGGVEGHDGDELGAGIAEAPAERYGGLHLLVVRREHVGRHLPAGLVLHPRPDGPRDHVDPDTPAPPLPAGAALP